MLSSTRTNFSLTSLSVARGRLLVGADGIKSRMGKQSQLHRKLLNLKRWVLEGYSLLTKDFSKGNVRADLLSWCTYLEPEASVQVMVEPMVWLEIHDKSRSPKSTCPISLVTCTGLSERPLLILNTCQRQRRRWCC
ncbi:hypothetical protein GGR52DRAFT_523578 [Hypoxylon sp. FL1284]|nr:hypothetical protein GGR52DRAFT_523578 [Hypoxylon sp. FL1284]